MHWGSHTGAKGKGGALFFRQCCPLCENISVSLSFRLIQSTTFHYHGVLRNKRCQKALSFQCFASCAPNLSWHESKLTAFLCRPSHPGSRSWQFCRALHWTAGGYLSWTTNPAKRQSQNQLPTGQFGAPCVLFSLDAQVSKAEQLMHFVLWGARISRDIQCVQLLRSDCLKRNKAELAGDSGGGGLFFMPRRRQWRRTWLHWTPLLAQPKNKTKKKFPGSLASVLTTQHNVWPRYLPTQHLYGLAACVSDHRSLGSTHGSACFCRLIPDKITNRRFWKRPFLNKILSAK